MAYLARFWRAGAPVDQGLVLVFPGPRSFTGEDVVELQGHGGAAVRAVLQACLEAGARPAAPGEFTQRAFLNHKLDLVQAESIAALIGAQSERALKAAAQALGGSLSAQVGLLQDEGVALQGRVEGLLDFPVESEGAEALLSQELLLLADRLRALAASHSRGRRLFERSRVVLAGPVNAGKSSLLNALLGEERALVDAEAGTTRDLVEADAVVEGLPLRLVDTAGWREAGAGSVEARGIARGQQAASQADLTLWVTSVEALLPAPDPSWLCVATQLDRHLAMSVPAGVVGVSAHTGDGLDVLWKAIVARLSGDGPDPEVLVTQERQALHLRGAADALVRAAGHVPMLELVAEELLLAQQSLAEVRGQGASLDVMDQVFSQFCIGK
jgi:tRNA modification GTPase